mmetsp:Transcript_637/g.1036  ORF Transcript_637/g.1036 Transcript_637/m.1036 type:complete len:87 (-) Transcript_637:319-579(-)
MSSPLPKERDMLIPNKWRDFGIPEILCKSLGVYAGMKCMIMDLKANTGALLLNGCTEASQLKREKLFSLDKIICNAKLRLFHCDFQ